MIVCTTFIRDILFFLHVFPRANYIMSCAFYVYSENVDVPEKLIIIVGTTTVDLEECTTRTLEE